MAANGNVYYGFCFPLNRVEARFDVFQRPWHPFSVKTNPFNGPTLNNRAHLVLFRVRAVRFQFAPDEKHWYVFSLFFCTR